MRIDAIKIEEEIKNLIERMHSVKSLTEYKKIKYSILNLIDIYETLTCTIRSYKMPINEYYENLIYRKTCNEAYEIEESLNRKEEYKKFIDKVLKTFDEEEYEPLIKKQSRIIEQESIDLIRSFFNEYDPKLDKLFLNSIDGLIDSNNRKIISTNFTSNIPALNKSYILVNDNNCVEDVITLIHEIGHVYQFSVLNNISLNQICALEKYDYLEVFSMFLETIFVDYLKQNRIMVEDALISENHFYEWVLSEFNKLDELTEFNSPECFYDLNIFDEFNNSLLYSCGGLTALELNNHYNQDKKETKRKIDLFISYSGLNDYDEMLKYLDIKKEDIYSSKVLKKKLNKHKKEVKNHYN